METRNIIPSERGRAANGIKAAALVVILGAVALMADHAFFIAPHARAAAEAPAAAAAPASVATDGFALPDNLRPNQGDVAPPPATF